MPFVWPDIAGTQTDPGVAFATVGPGPVFEIHSSEHEFTLEIRCTAGVPRAFDVLAEVSFDAQTTWLPWALKSVQCSAAATDVSGVSLDLPTNCEARISVRRWGGTANTRIAGFAMRRTHMPPPTAYGQPLELSNHQRDGVECWGDGAGGHAHIGLAFVPEPQAAANQLWIPTGEADTLVVDVLIAAVAATTVEIEVRETTNDTTTTNEQMAVNSVTAGVISTSVGQDQIPGAIGRHQTREISVRPGTSILILAKYTGGAGAGEVSMLARLYKLGR